VNQFEGRDTSEYDDSIKAYLTFAKPPLSELAANKHYAHIKPFQDPEIPQTSFHIVLDMEKDMLEGSNLKSLPHEIYRIRRDDQVSRRSDTIFVAYMFQDHPDAFCVSYR
jgi:hypothetical protein